MKVKLTNVASYDSDGVIIDNLDKFNFIYGNNGCGKSTLSKVLKAPEVYPECIIETTEESFRTLVYNKDFLEGYLESLNDGRRRELRQLLKYIQHETSETFSLGDLMAYLVEQPIKWLFHSEREHLKDR